MSSQLRCPLKGATNRRWSVRPLILKFLILSRPDSMRHSTSAFSFLLRQSLTGYGTKSRCEARWPARLPLWKPAVSRDKALLQRRLHQDCAAVLRPPRASQAGGGQPEPDVAYLVSTWAVRIEEEQQEHQQVSWLILKNTEEKRFCFDELERS